MKYTLLVAGGHGVGKTTLINRVVSGDFNPDGPDELTTTLGGQEVMLTTDPSRTRNGVILVFDVSDPLLTSDKICHEVALYPRELLVVLINKCDINAVSKAMSVVSELPKKLKFFLTSYKSNWNYAKPFDHLLSRLAGVDVRI